MSLAISIRSQTKGQKVILAVNFFSLLWHKLKSGTDISSSELFMFYQFLFCASGETSNVGCCGKQKCLGTLFSPSYCRLWKSSAEGETGQGWGSLWGCSHHPFLQPPEDMLWTFKMLPYSLRHWEGSPQGNEEAIIWLINESFLYLRCFYCLNWVTSHIGCHSGKEHSLCGFFLQVYQCQLAIYINWAGGRKDKLKFNIRKMGGRNIVNHFIWLPLS